MDYEKKYNEALSQARFYYGNCPTEPEKKKLENIFPELRESEDEQNWKEVLKYIKDDSLRSWLEKQKESLHICKSYKENANSFTSEDERIRKEIVEHIKDQIDSFISAPDCRDKYEEEELTRYKSWLAYLEKQKEQKPAEKQDYSGLNDLERAIHRGFLSAGVENVSVTIIKETAWECLAQMNPAEWNDTDMKEARDSLISVCRDWERGQKTTLLPIAAVRARYFLEHLTEPKPVGWSEEDKEMLMRCIAAIPVQGDEIMPTSYLNKLRNWLEFLPERFNPPPKQEWSETDEKMLTGIIERGSVQVPPYTTALREEQIEWLMNRLKSLRPQPHWKPSKEQMNYLCAAVDAAIRKHNESVSGYKPARILKSLYEELQKLM